VFIDKQLTKKNKNWKPTRTRLDPPPPYVCRLPCLWRREATSPDRSTRGDRKKQLFTRRSVGIVSCI